jgi:hypothetical protein
MEATDKNLALEPDQMRELRDGAALTTHVWDLSAHEQRRLAAVLAARPDFEPAAALAGEAEAHRLLYSGLDAEQQATYQMLVRAGVLDA